MTLNETENPLSRFSTAQGQQIYISKVSIKCAIVLHPVFLLKQPVRYNHLIDIVYCKKKIGILDWVLAFEEGSVAYEH